jgi:hypothetical protein
VEVAVHELQGVFKPAPTQDKYIYVHGAYVEI